MIEAGSKVFVRWYNEVLQGEVVESKKDGSVLDRMVSVRIPLMGTTIIALFAPGHVYMNVADMPASSQKKSSVTTLSDIEAPAPVIGTSAQQPSEAWKLIQDFKSAHWDKEHNHLQIEYLDQFYQMWRDSVAEKMDTKAKPACPLPSKAVMTSDTQNTCAQKQVAVPEEKRPERKPKKIVQLSFDF